MENHLMDTVHNIARNPTCFARLENTKKIGFSPKVIFDCGASVGLWTIKTSKLFTGSQLVSIEPNKKIINTLKEKTSVISPRPIIIEGAVGEKNGKTYLNIWDNDETKMSGSSLKGHVQGEPREKMEIELYTLDELAQELNMKPDLIKLDLQGGEIEALRGAKQLLETTEMFIIEFGVLEAYINRATPRQLLDIMIDNNYCLYDVVDLIYRPYDDALTGGDFFFVKNSSVLSRYKGYS
jgi:FkbM family methyltransferase